MERANEERQREMRERAHRKEMSDRVARLVRQVITVPDHFDRVVGHYLYADRYRVNVFVASTNDEGNESRRIAQSYFVASNGEEIIWSRPMLMG